MRQRSRAWRRNQARQKAQARAARRRYMERGVVPGKLRDYNGACGCWMCKPWKWGAEPERPASERRNVPNVPPEQDLHLSHKSHSERS